MTHKNPDHIEIRGARAHNLKNIDVDIPLGCITGIAGVSGSGKSSLALGVLYAEGSRRYLESLSTYTRRRMTEASRAQVDDVRYVPASLALHQRPGVPGIRSTFGTSTELLNSLRLMFSRLASHKCPNGHYVPPSMNVAAEREIICPECGVHFYGPGAEDLAFNSGGACPECEGTGLVRTVDESTLVPDENLTIDEGAVLPWQTLMWSLMKDIARDLGVRTDVPFRELTEKEREIVFHGEPVKHHMIYQNKTNGAAGEMDFTYFNATYTVENALSKVKDEKGMKRVEKFLHEGICPCCNGTRLSEKARSPLLRGISLDKACEMTLSELIEWVNGVPSSLSEEMRDMAERICESFNDTARRLVELGLSYISLDRAASTLSTGERQRMQLARAVRNRTTGVLYVLDEPSIGLHPSNLQGLLGVMDDLVADGNSVVLVDHDTQVLSHSDWIVELGPEAGAKGGTIIAQGTVEQIAATPKSKIAAFLKDSAGKKKSENQGGGKTDGVRGSDAEIRSDDTDKSSKTHVSGTSDKNADKSELFSSGKISLKTGSIHTVHPLDVEFPKGKLSVVTGVSGSGKTTLILESLVPALQSFTEEKKLPPHVISVNADGISHVKLIDATPIGINIRSTVATYANIHDELRKVYARAPLAKSGGWKAGDFSYNTGALRCPTCDGTGSISLDVQFLPDVDIPCPDCHGSRYSKEAYLIKRIPKKKATAEVEPVETSAALDKVVSMNSTAAPSGSPSTEGLSLPALMELSVDEAILECADLPLVKSRLQVLHDIGLGYLTLGEQTPSLSGGEAQRLKLASEMGRTQSDAVFVFDEPTIGLHPLGVQTLLDVFRHLIKNGATVIVIEHDLDVIRTADYIVDMGPGGGKEGGTIVASGTPEEIRQNKKSITGRFL